MATQSLRGPSCNLSGGVQLEVTQGHMPSPGTCNGPSLELAWSRPDLKLVWGQWETQPALGQEFTGAGPGTPALSRWCPGEREGHPEAPESSIRGCGDGCFPASFG